MNPSQLRTGDYIINTGPDNQNNRLEAATVMRNNGCKSIRYERFPEYTLCHGYLQEGLQFPADETWH